MAIGPYNGWSGKERMVTLPVQQQALRSGKMTPPTRCSICLVEGSSDWRASDAIVFHDENYAEPLAAYPICKPCHGRVHLRFAQPQGWQAHVARHARGGAWFELLSLDPQSRDRPFAETYPNGLPGPFDP